MWRFISLAGMGFSLFLVFVDVLVENYLAAAIWAGLFYISHSVFNAPEEKVKNDS